MYKCKLSEVKPKSYKTKYDYYCDNYLDIGKPSEGNCGRLSAIMRINNLIVMLENCVRSDIRFYERIKTDINSILHFEMVNQAYNKKQYFINTIGYINKIDVACRDEDSKVIDRLKEIVEIM